MLPIIPISCAMQRTPRTLRRSATLAVLAVCAAGCIKDVSSDERLDRGSPDVVARVQPTPEELRRVRCDDIDDGLARARSEERPETERVNRYLALYESLKSRRHVLDEALTRNPDLAYQQGSEELIAARDLCGQRATTVGRELERFVRELVALPAVKDIKGGVTITIVRMDFPTVRRAIDLLNPEDRDVLVSKLEKAERKLKP